MQWLVDGVNAIITILYNFTNTIGFPSYALAIIILTILLKLALYPLSVKQMNSMKNMQAIQPKVQEIQKKYKNSIEPIYCNGFGLWLRIMAFKSAGIKKKIYKIAIQIYGRIRMILYK